MTNTDQHPDPAQLAAFLDGMLSEADRSAVESHVDCCAECCEALARVPMDALSERLREVDTSADEWSVVTEAGLPKTSDVASQQAPEALENHARYRILEPLGKGGMGVVYKAQHRMMDRIVALKVIDGRWIDNPQMIERFRTEVKAAALLNHANIVRAYDAEQAGDLHFLVMEFVDGISLAELVRRNGPLPIDQALGVTRKVAHGLHHAFQQGMVHRDIKPQNIMITRTGKVRILDFGLARFARERDTAAAPDGAPHQSDSEALTLVGSILGTPDYIAPEQITNARNADTRADIYSLGCTCFFLLTGHPPFPDGTAIDKVLSHRDGNAPAVSEIRGEVSPEVCQLVARMMARDPEDRFQTPAELASEIDGLLSKLPAALGDRNPQTRGLTETTSGQARSGGQSQGKGLSGPPEIVDPAELLPETQHRTGRWRRRHDASGNGLAGVVLPLVVVIAFIAVLVPGIGYLFSGTDSGGSGLLPDNTGSDGEAAVGLPAIGSATETVGDWIDLIASAEPEQNSYPGVWERRGNELMVDSAASARLPLNYDVPREYDFEVTFTRHEGQHSIALIFVSGSGQATFEVDAWGEHLAGIQMIDGVTFQSTNGNPTRTAEFQLSNGEQHKMTVRVRSNGVQALLDGISVATYRGNGANLSTIAQWALQTHGGRLGIGAYESPTTFHSIRVRRVVP